MKKSILSVLIAAVLLFVAACGNGSGSIFKDGIEEFISNTYPLYDTIASTENSDQYARVYRAENQDIASVADSLQGHEEPTEMSEENEGKQIFIYDQYFVTLTQSEDNASNTMIEVAEEEFVRNNYSPGFFEGYLLASLLGNIFGNNWSTQRNQTCNLNPERCYGGYNSSGSYVGKTSTPTIRGASTNRGGGTGSGK
ncbi:DUF4247 domain-containing protein [Jeotgalibacillus campisalis]|uniref:DUF4247 domain-containing protein n=1 Tax=Jeotgalibacillus campisalis TaxID=220754 RepID=A0A0C2VPQ0_9BACL|nr:DUF4247 domain-containing protein [Jeotgalibacillus campisalis]KIL46416.1 hypothetical protein KR50_30910 [Jeotgalibacillus campisalis]